MAHKTLAFPAGDGRTRAVTTTRIMGSVMALAQLELVKMAGAGSKPGERSESSVAAVPTALASGKICSRAVNAQVRCGD